MTHTEDYSQIKGFNYFLKPDYSFTESWITFNAESTELELRRAKGYFPKINTIRIQLAWDVYNVDPERFGQTFESCLCIADRLGLKIIPTLFSRCPAMGNIFTDHFMEGWNWITVRSGGSRKDMFTPYLKSIVGAHRDDERINIWDICNEPFPYTPGSYGMDRVPEDMKHIEQGEYDWMKEMYDVCRNEINPTAPLGISVLQDFGRYGLEKVEDISDILLIHPYYVHDQDNEEEKAAFIAMLDDYAAIAREVNKPLVATETCWPSQDDQWHIDNSRFTLTELKKRNIGWVAAKLHQCARERQRLPGEPIRGDGTLRPGHELYNEF